MKAEYINPFLKATAIVLQQVAGLNLEKGPITKKDSPFTAFDVAVIVGVTGKVKGTVIYSMAGQTAMNIASAMMGGMPVTALDELSKSAISELGNMISGNAGAEFYNLGITIDITPPSLLTGQNIQVSNKIETICISFKTVHGDIEVDVALKEVEGK